MSTKPQVFFTTIAMHVGDHLVLEGILMGDNIFIFKGLELNDHYANMCLSSVCFSNLLSLTLLDLVLLSHFAQNKHKT
jgi:hypothetical protein